MRKITALIMMALMITIGGVYASWVYSEGVTTETNLYIKDMANVHMDSVNKDNAKGTITLDYSAAQFVVADDGEGTEGSAGYGDHIAELDVDGTLVFKFTPNKGASVTSIDIEYKVSVSDVTVTWEDYTDSTQKQIFTVASSDWVTLEDVDASGVAVNATDLGLALGGTFYLPTYADYASFQSKLNSFSIVITVREKVSA